MKYRYIWMILAIMLLVNLCGCSQKDVEMTETEISENIKSVDVEVKPEKEDTIKEEILRPDENQDVYSEQGENVMKVEESASTPTSTSLPTPTPTPTKVSAATSVPTPELESISTPEPSVPVHTHNWVEVTESIPHEEVGHWETKVIKEAWTETVKGWVTRCSVCQLDMTNYTDDEILDHIISGCYGRYYTVYETIATIPHDAETEDVWVVDQEAYTETKVIGYKCDCGEIK